MPVRSASPHGPILRPMIIVTLLVAAGLIGPGCNLLIPFAILGEKAEKVPAEFDKLEGKRVAIVGAGQRETLHRVRAEVLLAMSQ